MTGKDWIIYILTQTFLTKERVAIEMGVGVETVKTTIQLELLPRIQIGGEIYIRNDFKKLLRGENEES